MKFLPACHLIVLVFNRFSEMAWLIGYEDSFELGLMRSLIENSFTHFMKKSSQSRFAKIIADDGLFWCRKIVQVTTKKSSKNKFFAKEFEDIIKNINLDKAGVMILNENFISISCGMLRIFKKIGVFFLYVKMRSVTQDIYN